MFTMNREMNFTNKFTSCSPVILSCFCSVGLFFPGSQVRGTLTLLYWFSNFSVFIDSQNTQHYANYTR